MRNMSAVMMLAALASGCALLDQVMQMNAFARCQFRLVSVERPALAGIRIDGKKSARDFGLRDGLKFAAATAGKTLPLEFALNIEVKNPNQDPAGMNRLEWILLIDGNEITRGQLDRRVDIPGGGTAPMQLDIRVDLRQVLSGQSLDAMLNLAFNVAGEGTHPTRITLKAKPSIMVGEQAVDFPDYITVNTEFGGPAGQK